MTRHLSTSGLLISTRVYFDHFGLAFAAFLKKSSSQQIKIFFNDILQKRANEVKKMQGKVYIKSLVKANNILLLLAGI